MASKKGYMHYGVVRMLLKAKALTSRVTLMADSMVECACVLSPLCMSGLSSGECKISWYMHAMIYLKSGKFGEGGN